MLLKYIKALKYAVAMMIDNGSTQFVSKDKETYKYYFIEWEKVYNILDYFEDFLETL